MSRLFRMPWLSDMMMVAGALIVCAAALAYVQNALAAQLRVERPYLISQARLPLEPLGPTAPPLSVGAPAPQAPPAPTEALASLASTPAAPAELTPAPSSGPVVRLVIPALKIDRVVIPIGMRPAGNGRLDWDTDALFATRNRLDLVGQPVISTNPGDGGNVILIGHNYDQGIYAWNGVFVSLKTIPLGSQIQIFTQGGGVFTYQVERVKEVPWAEQSQAELEKHMKYLGPSPSEQLTLVTCGGANVWPWPARIYVVAAPVSP